MADSKRIEWIELMRGFAAIWVVLHHAKKATDHFLGDLGSQPFLANGNLGVDFFFILSGYIIAYSSQRLLEKGGGFRQYITARFTRIYIPYWPIGIGMVLLYLAFPDVSQGDRDVSLFTSLTLLPAAAPPALSVAWTLVHEILFYIVFSLFFFSRKALFATLAIWAAVILAAQWTGVEAEKSLRYLLSPLNLLFLFGVILFHVSSRVKITTLPALGLMLLGLGLVLSESMKLEVNALLIALGFGALLLAATSELAARTTIARPLLVLGSASYAIYLVHNPVLSIAARAVRAMGLGTNAWVGYLIISSLALLAGLLYWKIYEQRAIRFVRTRLR